jgi:hypothetical protein
MIMATGVTAEEGDIVAIDQDEFEHPKLELYVKDMPYFAVEIMRLISSPRLKQTKEEQA